MEKSKQLLLLLLFIVPVYGSLAQDNFYFVTFKDKINNGFSVTQPSAFLSQKAIERRNKQGIAIIEQDLPISNTYKTSIINKGIEVFESSKWFNGVIIKSTQAEVDQLKNEIFVDAITYLAPNNYAGRMKLVDELLKEEDSPSDSLFQNQILATNKMHWAGYYGEGITIAVLDGGFRGVNTAAPFSHLFANGQVLYSYDFVSKSSNVYQYSSHGTKALSLMAAEIANSYQGIAPNANYLLFVTENVPTEYRIEEYYWLMGAERADSAGADVLSTSLGYSTFDDPSMNYSQYDMNGITTVVARAANIASEKGMVVVASAGNEGNNLWGTIVSPSDIVNGLSVGSIQTDYQRSSFSSFGPSSDGRIKPDVVALGSMPYLISETGVITQSSGTSFSCPQVAALVAGIWQAYPQFSNLEIINAIRMSADNVVAPNNEVGYGIPSYTAIINYLKSIDPTTQPVLVYPNPITNGDLLTIKVSDPSKSASVEMELYETSGKKIATNVYSVSWSDNEAHVELNYLPQGLYFLKVLFDSSSEEFRIVKL